MFPPKGQNSDYLRFELGSCIINSTNFSLNIIIRICTSTQKMNILLLFLLAMTALAIEREDSPFQCKLYLYSSKPDPQNLFDETRAFVLPYDYDNFYWCQVKFPLQQPDFALMKYGPQYYEKPINSVKYVVAQGRSCSTNCWLVVNVKSFTGEPLIPGEIYTLDKCEKDIWINCDYV